MPKGILEVALELIVNKFLEESMKVKNVWRNTYTPIKIPRKSHEKFPKVFL